MCGIVAILGKENFQEPIIQGLTLLKSRGYDSCGVCYVEKGELKTIKYASINTHNSLEILEKEIEKSSPQSKIAIAHTRWATHGNVSDKNAHPHSDNKNRISVVHNGIIETSQELKKELKNLGYIFNSQTDTEVISVMVGYNLDQGFSMEIAIENTLQRLSGTWALVFIHRDYPNKIWLTRNGSPLLLGMDDEYIMIASEQIAFGNYIKKYIVLDNHDILEISKGDDNKIQYSKSIHRYTMNNKVHSEIELSPINLGYPHWMLKEISEQSDSIIRAISNGGRIESNICVKLGGLDSNSQRLMDLNHIILLGCGTSYHSGLWALDIFKNLDIFDTVTIYDGSEFNIKDIPKKGKTGVILISQSGETKDLHRCIQIANDSDLITIGVVNVVDSMIARETECGVYLNAGREVSVASTKSFTNQCIILSMIAVWFSQKRGTCIKKRKQIIMDLRNLSYQMGKIIDTCVDSGSIIQRIITEIGDKQSMFLLGKGQSQAIALEGSLKIKEVSYIHAEGYSSSSLKHGPLALITPGLPIVLLNIDDEYRDKNRNCYQEINARNAFIIHISNCIEDKENENNDNENNITIIIERNNTFGGLLANSVIQILSYFLSIRNGNNPDFPRNLAKVVTVE